MKAIQSSCLILHIGCARAVVVRQTRPRAPVHRRSRVRRKSRRGRTPLHGSPRCMSAISPIPSPHHDIGKLAIARERLLTPCRRSNSSSAKQSTTFARLAPPHQLSAHRPSSPSLHRSRRACLQPLLVSAWVNHNLIPIMGTEGRTRSWGCMGRGWRRLR
jgi:hypothetical protein